MLRPNGWNFWHFWGFSYGTLALSHGLNLAVHRLRITIDRLLDKVIKMRTEISVTP